MSTWRAPIFRRGSGAEGGGASLVAGAALDVVAGATGSVGACRASFRAGEEAERTPSDEPGGGDPHAALATTIKNVNKRKEDMA
jgi:hypothetical protein